jgi:hypothetical protein
MRKITKKNGIELIGKASFVKNVLCGYIDKEKAEQLLNMNNTEYTEKTCNCAKKTLVKATNTQLVFEVEGHKSWLTGLVGSNFYEVNTNNGNFVLVEFLDGNFSQCIAYELCR